MGDDDQPDIQILDTENFRGGNNEVFSHSSLVMKAMNKTIELACREMRSGWFNHKTDRRGNSVLVYVDDTRKQFIEAVKTTEMVMSCDLDEEAKNKIQEIKNKLNLKFKQLCEIEKQDWILSNSEIKKERWRRGIFFRDGYLHPDLTYSQDYIEEMVNTYREIFKELTNLTSRIDFYKEEFYEN